MISFSLVLSSARWHRCQNHNIGVACCTTITIANHSTCWRTVVGLLTRQQHSWRKSNQEWMWFIFLILFFIIINIFTWKPFLFCLTKTKISKVRKLLKNGHGQMDTVGGSNAISTLSGTIKTTWQQNERQREGRDQHIHCRTKQSLTCNETAPVILPLEEEKKNRFHRGFTGQWHFQYCNRLNLLKGGFATVTFVTNTEL